MTVNGMTLELHRALGIELNNRTWGLMDKPEHTSADQALMLEYAHASAHHWAACGTDVNRQRAYWLISRVYAVLEMPQPCLLFACLCRELTETASGEMRDFDCAYSYEALARAYALAGEKEKGTDYYARAATAGEGILGEEDRKIFTTDLHSGILLQIFG